MNAKELSAQLQREIQEQEERASAQRVEDDILRERLLMAETRIVQLQRQVDDQRPKPTKRNHTGPGKRSQIFSASKGFCFYCGKHIHRATFTIDHVWPLSKGGTNILTNQVAACGPCNFEKGDSLPTEGEIIAAEELYRGPRKHSGTGNLQINGVKEKKKNSRERDGIPTDPGMAFMIRSAKCRPIFRKRARNDRQLHSGGTF